jgi:hypothetical protein
MNTDLSQSNRCRLVLQGANTSCPWEDWLETPIIRTGRNGRLFIEGGLPDQAALFGLLACVRDLGLILVSVEIISISEKEKNMKKNLLFALKFLVLIVLMAVIFSIGGSLLGPDVPWSPEMQTGALNTLPLVFFTYTAVIAAVIMRSAVGGWKLMLGLAISWYGVQTFMAQIETAYFGPALGVDPAWLSGFFLQGLPVALIFVPLAVLILGKGRNYDENPAAGARLALPPAEWAWKLAVIAVLYVILYFSFGYVVAWSNPALAAMYGNGANTDVFDAAKLIPLQFGRGVLWALFALPVIRMSKGKPWQIALLVGVLLALPMNIAHALPNPIMPDPSVRLSHFIETTTSNFIFGYLLTLLILWRPRRQVSAPVEQA